MALTRIPSTGLDQELRTQIELGGGPKIANVQIANSSWSVLDDTAVGVDGGYIVVNGTGFQSGCQVIIEDTAASSVSFVDANTVHVTVAARSAGSYNIYVVNPDGGTTIGVNALTYSSFPTWVTSGTLSYATTGVEYSYQLTAVGATSYSLQAGSSLPANATLHANGLLVGTTDVESNTDYSFTVVATDGEYQDSPRTFSLTIAAAVTISVSYMLVGAGGGAGGNRGGGGAGGGFITGTIDLLDGATYNVSIGAGGSGQNTSVDSARGGNTSISGAGVTLTAVGGGRGGGNIAAGLGNNGGSGGSGGGGGSGAGIGGLGIYPGSSYIDSSRQGYDGGTQGGSGGSGGGGAGGAGAGSTSISGAAGGPGATGLDGSTYAAGGAGGYGQDNQGGGGSGSNGTGNGGNGGSGNVYGGAGGSGALILKVPDTLPIALDDGASRPTVTTSGGYRYYKWTTAGSGTIAF